MAHGVTVDFTRLGFPAGAAFSIAAAASGIEA